MKPTIAILRGGLLSPFEMQAFEPLKRRYDLTTFTPHETRFDLSTVELPRESLYCPLVNATFLDKGRQVQALRDRLTGQTHSYCGLAPRLVGFDLIHTADPFYCFSYEAALAKRRTGSGLVVTQWENIPHKNERKFVERQTKRALHLEADLFLAVSEGAKAALLAEGVPGEKIRKVYPGIDTRHFTPGPPDRPLRKQLGLGSKDWVVLYAGRLSREKGVFTLLEAFNGLVRQNPQARLVLAGKDEDRVVEYVRKNGLANVVKISAPLPYEQMPELYRQADLFVLPSLPTKGWIEQFGFVLAEAQACGVPVIGSDSGAIPEVVGDLNRTFPAGHAGRLEAALRESIRWTGPKASRQARERALRLFSLESFGRQVQGAYETVLSAVRKRRTA